MARKQVYPGKGCRLCHKGAKMVLFITGICDRSCWYCPLSRERRGKDAVWANDRQVSGAGELLKEAEAMSALGTGVTGGEPLLVLDRVVEYCRLLKEHFGSAHHIHLYTGRAPARSDLLALKGLVDEIRLHPPREVWEEILDSDYAASAREARELGFSIGIEVPALPGLDYLIPALPLLDFLNINELEWGETNADAMRARDLVPEDGLHNAIQGARGWAEAICSEKKVHFCTSRFKDSVQLRERLKRIAGNTARPFDDITEDGTIVYGVIEGSHDPATVISLLEPKMFEVFPGRIEVAWWILSERAGDLEGTMSIVERYPNNGMIVEVTPL